ncbi:MAG: hypothetical protein HQK81_06065 [Desulfovibrionaceae bacterium]|nr:hypothetical protein [Desulfovibrionaceae bacterium]MBF0513614.1 hypothetical protein [Desulfovibrionaceae bacterium]
MSNTSSLDASQSAAADSGRHAQQAATSAQEAMGYEAQAKASALEADASSQAAAASATQARISEDHAAADAATIAAAVQSASDQASTATSEAATATTEASAAAASATASAGSASASLASQNAAAASAATATTEANAAATSATAAAASATSATTQAGAAASSATAAAASAASAQALAGGGAVKIDGGDTTAATLNSKLTLASGSALTKTVASPGGNEALVLDVAAMAGATSSLVGTKGLVPAPAAGDQVKYLKGDGSWGAIAIPAASLNSDALTGLVVPACWRDLYRNGWTPAFFNQQWGGTGFGFELDGVEYECATGCQCGSPFNMSIGDASARTLVSQGFQVGQALSVGNVFLRIGKIGNPADNVTCAIYSDSGGNPSALVANATATAVPGKSVTGATGAPVWVRCNFATPPALAAGTQYHVVIGRSGAVDGSNYYMATYNSASNYPCGKRGYYNGSAWAGQDAGSLIEFMIAPTAATGLKQTGGLFAGKLVFSGTGSPLNHSRGLCNDLRRLYDGQSNLTIRLAAGSMTTGKTFLDLLYGLDHDRINARVESNVIVVRLYRQDGTVAIVTGTTNVTGAGPFDVMISARMKGDGADFLKLSVNGASEGTPLTGQTFTMDPLFAQLGAVWLGGGFGPAPAWTQAMTFASLPSAQGWTWTGTATEANAFSASGGKLYQNKNGFGATDTGYYRKTSAGFSNANGAVYAVKLKAVNSCNIFGNSTVNLSIFDGTKQACNCVSGYFVQPYIGDFLKTVQGKFDQECVHVITSKGSDAFLFCNGRLLLDGTGINTISAAGANELWLGDNDGTSGNNSDIVYDYAKYSNTGAILPEFSGMTLHEVAFWSADMTGLAATLYNGGTLKSVKDVCGVPVNAVSIAQTNIFYQKGITNAPATSSIASGMLCPEMSRFVLGENFNIDYENTQYVVSGSPLYTYIDIMVDGVVQSTAEITPSSTGLALNAVTKSYVNKNLGLHYVMGDFYGASGNNISGAGAMRYLNVEVK